MSKDDAISIMNNSNLNKNRGVLYLFSLQKRLTYALASVPHYLGTPDGSFAKTNRVSMLHFLMKDNVKEVKYTTKRMFIQDANTLFHSLIGSAPTFGSVSLQMLSQMAQKQNFIFSTNSYHQDSIKGQERVQKNKKKQELDFVSRRYFVLTFIVLMVFLLRCLFGI